MSYVYAERTSFSCTVGGGTISGHQGADSTSESTAFETTCGNEYAAIRAQIAAGAAGVIWTSATSVQQVNAFTRLWVKSDQDIYLRLRQTGTGSVTLRIKANAPFLLSSQTIGNAFTDAVISGAPTDALIDSISVWNDAASAANIQLYLFSA